MSVLIAGCTTNSSSSDISDTPEATSVSSSDAGTSTNSYDSFAEKIHELEDDQTITLLWVTDTHYRASDAPQHAKVPEYLDSVYEVARALGPSALIVDGDIVDGRETLDVHYAAVETMVAKLQESPVPVLAVRGNHDGNPYYTENVTGNNVRDEVVDTSWLAANLIGPVIDAQCVANPYQQGGCTYYYRDFPASRTRVVVLDDIDVPYSTDDEGHLRYRSLVEFGIGADQMEWLAHEALTFVEGGWAVLVLAHVNLDDDRPYGLRAWGDVPRVHNDSKVIELLEAFAEGGSGVLESDDEDFSFEIPYDFSTNPSNEFIGFLNGHTHRDQCHFQDGHLSVTLRGFTEGAPARLDAVVVDRAKKLVRTRAFDTVSGISADWDLDYTTGAGIPDTFNYYWSGTYVTDDGTQAG